MDSTEKVKSRWAKSFYTALNRRNDEERYICDICQRDLGNPSNLALHRNTHVIERPFKCEPCQVSFNTQGHLEKHKRSSAHENRVTMTQAFGVPTSDNPRPYGCPECEIAFRKHGHLAKHLRSKSHITKMETNGLVPAGTCAAFEKCSSGLKDKLVTTNCELSLISLRSIAFDILLPHAHQQQPDLQQHYPDHQPLHSPLLSSSSSSSSTAQASSTTPGTGPTVPSKSTVSSGGGAAAAAAASIPTTSAVITNDSIAMPLYRDTPPLDFSNTLALSSRGITE